MYIYRIRNCKRLISIALLVMMFAYIQVWAQKNSAENTGEQSKKDELEVTNFADSFLDSFLENKDLSKIPAEFFDDGFKYRFPEYADCSTLDELIPNADRYRVANTVHNFTNLLTIIVGSSFDKEKDPDSKDFSFMKNLPPNIFKELEKSKWLKTFVTDDEEKDYPKPKDSSQLTELIDEMSAVSAEMTVYLQTHPVKTSKSFLKFRKDNFKYHPAEMCEGESCMGLPEKTPIFSVHELMMCLRIARINNQWKIVQIYSIACED